MSTTTESKKKMLTWSLSEDGMTLKLTTDAGNREFPIADFWKTSKFERLEDVEKLCVLNGLKQKLADKVAASKELQLSMTEKLAIIDETWKRLTTERQWNKPSEGKRGFVSKIDTALAKATAEEMAMMVKLGLTTQAKVDAELERRAESTPEPAPAPEPEPETKPAPKGKNRKNNQ